MSQLLLQKHPYKNDAFYKTYVVTYNSYVYIVNLIDMKNVIIILLQEKRLILENYVCFDTFNKGSFIVWGLPPSF